VPLVPRGIVSRRASLRRRVTFEEMVDAGEAMLMEMARLARGYANN
jgi:pyroglutamyl-peptidase